MWGSVKAAKTSGKNLSRMNNAMVPYRELYSGPQEHFHVAGLGFHGGGTKNFKRGGHLCVSLHDGMSLHRSSYIRNMPEIIGYAMIVMDTRQNSSSKKYEFLP
jgi:hypothetical protein